MRRLPMMLALAALVCVACPAAAAVTVPAPTENTASDALQAARKVMMNDPAAALKIGIALEKSASDVPDGRPRRLLLSKAKWIAGEASLRLNRIDDARRLIDGSYALAKIAGDRQSEGNALLSRGSIKSQGGDVAGALADFLEAYRHFLATADARSQSITLQYLSQLYTDARDYKRAHSYLRQAVASYRKEPMLQLSYANSLGNLLAEQGQFGEAETEYRRALAIAREMGVHNLELLLFSNLAGAQIKRGRLSVASRTIDEADITARLTKTAIGNDLRAAKARLAFAQGDVRLARKIMDDVSLESGRTQKPLDANTEYEAYKIYKAAGEIEPAMAHLEVAGRLHNEALALGISTQASLMAARFDFATQDLRIAALKATALKQDVALGHQAETRQRMVIAAVSVSALAVLATLSIWLAALRRSRNQFRNLNRLLGQSNLALEAALCEVRQRAVAENAARQLALHDPLTGLPNRRFLNEVFEDSFQPHRPDDANVVILLLDLDRFKPINDIHGHGIGDQVLIEVAGRLTAFCKDINGTAVRLGGDEFVVIMSSTRSNVEIELLAQRIIVSIAEPIYIGTQRLTLGGSIGIVRSSSSNRTIETLLRSADIAMYEAKRAGRDSCRFFDPAMKSRQRLRVA